MNRRCVACRYLSGSLAIITGTTGAAPVTVIVNTSSASFDMRKQVVSLTGILNVTNCTEQVARGDFARMLINASNYRENLPAVSVSVFADVSSINLNTVYIRVVTPQGWMSGFLGGFPKPDEYITYKDAVKAFLTTLDYTDENFTGDLVSSRISKFNYLELNEEVNRQGDEVLNQIDCMNMFYNLLKTTPKDSSSIYGAALGYELNSDGEINPISTLEDERKGPIPVRKGFSVVQSVLLDTENANVFLNGVASTLEPVKLSQKDAGFAIIHYNVESKIIWAYTAGVRDQDDSSGNNPYVLLRGEIKNIYYKSTGVMTPTSVRTEIDEDNSDDDFDTDDSLDSDGYLTVELNSSELQYLFPIYEQLGVGDEVVLVRNESDSSYTAVNAIEH